MSKLILGAALCALSTSVAAQETATFDGAHIDVLAGYDRLNLRSTAKLSLIAPTSTSMVSGSVQATNAHSEVFSARLSIATPATKTLNSAMTASLWTSKTSWANSTSIATRS